MDRSLTTEELYDLLKQHEAEFARDDYVNAVTAKIAEIVNG